ncbi:uncharacterized protein LOC131893577 isoform X5 [Tigriopus californicus]|uniref:uncharacterized protein LOC131893577 isoform X5 n=1 Tax=Tigriopus californicus TaxID=6832 RepID=UPI0027DA02D2|nr:uncharacterized protein LOC131893577 isoform X5 [Tigriopus californicus]
MAELILSKDNALTQDPIIQAIGKFGKLQSIMFVVIGVFYIFNSWTDVILVFLNVQTDFWCSIPAHLKDKMSVEEWKQQSGQTESSCAIYNVTYPMN